jgi:predicted nucleic acid-binding protein
MRVYLDTNCIIYFVENHPQWWPKVIARLMAFRSAKDELAVGDLARAECLVGPFKNGDAGLESRYRVFFNDPDIHVFCLSRIWKNAPFGLA